MQKWVAFLCLAPCGGWRVGFAWGAKRGGVFFFGLPSGAEEDEACPSMCAKTFNEQKHEDRPRLGERLDYNARKDPDTLGAVPRASARAHLRPGLQPAPHPSVFLIL